MYHPPCLLFYTHTHTYIYIYINVLFMHHPVPLLFSLPPIWPRSWSATLLGRGAGRHSDASDGRFPGPSTLKSGKKNDGDNG